MENFGIGNFNKSSLINLANLLAFFQLFIVLLDIGVVR